MDASDSNHPPKQEYRVRLSPYSPPFAFDSRAAAPKMPFDMVDAASSITRLRHLRTDAMRFGIVRIRLHRPVRQMIQRDERMVFGIAVDVLPVQS